MPWKEQTKTAQEESVAAAKDLIKEQYGDDNVPNSSIIREYMSRYCTQAFGSAKRIRRNEEGGQQHTSPDAETETRARTDPPTAQFNELVSSGVNAFDAVHRRPVQKQTKKSTLGGGAKQKRNGANVGATRTSNRKAPRSRKVKEATENAALNSDDEEDVEDQDGDLSD